MCYQPNAPYYSTYQPQGLPQLNINNDFNNYNKFLPAGEQPMMPQEDFTNLSTSGTLALLGVVGIFFAKKIMMKSSPKPREKPKKTTKTRKIKPKREEDYESSEQTPENIDLYSSIKEQTHVPLSFTDVPTNAPLSLPDVPTDIPIGPIKKKIAITTTGEAVEIGGKTRKRKIKKIRKNKKYTKKRKHNVKKRY